jgi:hypothetical protein
MDFQVLSRHDERWEQEAGWSVCPHAPRSSRQHPPMRGKERGPWMTGSRPGEVPGQLTLRLSWTEAEETAWELLLLSERLYRLASRLTEVLLESRSPLTEDGDVSTSETRKN